MTDANLVFNGVHIRFPINKVASLVVNQCNCTDELQLNSIVEERAFLRERLQALTNAKPKKYGARNEITRIAKEIQKLNQKLKPYDEWHRITVIKTFDEAFRAIVKETFGDDIYRVIVSMAREMSK